MEITHLSGTSLGFTDLPGQVSLLTSNLIFELLVDGKKNRR